MSNPVPPTNNYPPREDNQINTPPHLSGSTILGLTLNDSIKLIIALVSMIVAVLGVYYTFTNDIEDIKGKQLAVVEKVENLAKAYDIRLATMFESVEYKLDRRLESVDNALTSRINEEKRKLDIEILGIKSSQTLHESESTARIERINARLNLVEITASEIRGLTRDTDRLSSEIQRIREDLIALQRRYNGNNYSTNKTNEE